MRIAWNDLKASEKAFFESCLHDEDMMSLLKHRFDRLKFVGHFNSHTWELGASGERLDDESIVAYVYAEAKEAASFMDMFNDSGVEAERLKEALKWRFAWFVLVDRLIVAMDRPLGPREFSTTPYANLAVANDFDGIEFVCCNSKAEIKVSLWLEHGDEITSQARLKGAYWGAGLSNTAIAGERVRTKGAVAQLKPRLESELLYFWGAR